MSAPPALHRFVRTMWWLGAVALVMSIVIPRAFSMPGAVRPLRIVAYICLVAWMIGGVVARWRMSKTGES